MRESQSNATAILCIHNLTSGKAMAHIHQVLTFSDVLYEGLLTLCVEIGGWVRNGVLWRERRLQRHGIESVQLLAVQLFPQTSPSVAEPHLNSSFCQFRPVKEDSSTQ